VSHKVEQRSLCRELLGRPSVMSSESSPTTERRAASSSGYCSTVPDNFLVVKTLAVKSGPEQRKLTDIRAFFAIFSCIYIRVSSFPGNAVAEQKALQGMEANGSGRRVHQSRVVIALPRQVCDHD